MSALFNVTSAGVGNADDIAGVKPHCLTEGAAMLEMVEQEGGGIIGCM